MKGLEEASSGYIASEYRSSLLAKEGKPKAEIESEKKKSSSRRTVSRTGLAKVMPADDRTAAELPETSEAQADLSQSVLADVMAGGEANGTGSVSSAREGAGDASSTSRIGRAAAAEKLVGIIEKARHFAKTRSLQIENNPASALADSEPEGSSAETVSDPFDDAIASSLDALIASQSQKETATQRKAEMSAPQSVVEMREQLNRFPTSEVRARPGEAVVYDVRDDGPLGHHTIVERPDGAKLYKNFVKHPDTLIVEQASGVRLWIRRDKPVCLETREGTWSTNNGGRSWMYQEPALKHIAGMDFRPWNKTGDRVSADELGNIMLKRKDGSTTTYVVDGTKRELTKDGTKQSFDTRGLLLTEEFPNGASISRNYVETTVGDPPVCKFVLDSAQLVPGSELVVRDAEQRPVRMWTPSGYRFEVGYDKKGEINSIDIPGLYSLTRKGLPGGKSEWRTTEGQKVALSQVRITDSGLLTCDEKRSTGHLLKLTVCSNGSYMIIGQTPQSDQYMVEGQDGLATRITNPAGDQSEVEYDERRLPKKVSMGKFGRVYELVEGKWHVAGASEHGGKPLDLQVKVEFDGSLTITHQVTADYYKVDKRNADGYQSNFTMDVKNGKWFSNERTVGSEFTQTIETDSDENRAETMYDHVDGSVRREVRDNESAGFIAVTDRSNRTIIRQFGWDGKYCGSMTSNDGKRWSVLDTKDRQLSEFTAAVDVHREGMTIKCLDALEEEMLVRTDAKGIPYFFRDSSGEWTSRDGLNWEQDNGPRSPKSKFVGRPALPDGYPLIAHDERVENFDDVVLVEEGRPVRFSSNEGHQYVFRDNKWLVEDKTRKRKAVPIAASPPASKS